MSQPNYMSMDSPSLDWSPDEPSKDPVDNHWLIQSGIRPVGPKDPLRGKDILDSLVLCMEDFADVDVSTPIFYNKARFSDAILAILEQGAYRVRSDDLQGDEEELEPCMVRIHAGRLQTATRGHPRHPEGVKQFKSLELVRFILSRESEEHRRVFIDTHLANVPGLELVDLATIYFSISARVIDEQGFRVPQALPRKGLTDLQTIQRWLRDGSGLLKHLDNAVMDLATSDVISELETGGYFSSFGALLNFRALKIKTGGPEKLLGVGTSSKQLIHWKQTIWGLIIVPFCRRALQIRQYMINNDRRTKTIKQVVYVRRHPVEQAGFDVILSSTLAVTMFIREIRESLGHLVASRDGLRSLAQHTAPFLGGPNSPACQSVQSVIDQCESRLNTLSECVLGPLDMLIREWKQWTSSQPKPVSICTQKSQMFEVQTVKWETDEDGTIIKSQLVGEIRRERKAARQSGERIGGQSGEVAEGDEGEDEESAAAIDELRAQLLDSSEVEEAMETDETFDSTEDLRFDPATELWSEDLSQGNELPSPPTIDDAQPVWSEAILADVRRYTMPVVTGRVNFGQIRLFRLASAIYLALTDTEYCQLPADKGFYLRKRGHFTLREHWDFDEAYYVDTLKCLAKMPGLYPVLRESGLWEELCEQLAPTLALLLLSDSFYLYAPIGDMVIDRFTSTRVKGDLEDPATREGLAHYASVRDFFNGLTLATTIGSRSRYFRNPSVGGGTVPWVRALIAPWRQFGMGDTGEYGATPCRVCQGSRPMLAVTGGLMSVRLGQRLSVSTHTGRVGWSTKAAKAVGRAAYYSCLEFIVRGRKYSRLFLNTFLYFACLVHQDEKTFRRKFVLMKTSAGRQLVHHL